MTRYLREIRDRYGAFTSFFVSEKSRIYYQTEGVLKRVQEDEPRDTWYFRLRDMKEPYEINMDPDLANRDALTIFINYRVLDYQGHYIGAAGVGLTVDAVRKLITDYQGRYQRNIYFVDKKGRIALFGNDAAAPGTSILAIDGLRDIAPRILETGTGSFQYRNGGLDYLLNVRFISELDWHLFVERAENEAFEGIRSTLYLNLAICVLITAIVLFATSLTINRYQRRLERMATTDKLTGLANRQAFDLLMDQAIREQARSDTSLLAMLIDIDNFKPVNDRLGHLAGDSVIRQVAATLRRTLRKADIVCRWGGEEFLVVVKDTADPGGRQLAEKIREAVATAQFGYKDDTIAVTVSIGIAVHREGETADQLIARADQALYAAKAAGRNAVHADG
jgi:diguanylate cyclase (GGDEF)-like protein